MSADISIDPVKCTGHGMCALLLAERVTLDHWGFPVVDTTPIDGRGAVRRAQRAARACPRQALHVNEREPAPLRSTVVP
jgi:ferredoxin